MALMLDFIIILINISQDMLMIAFCQAH
jgi:hypothetical protein